MNKLISALIATIFASTLSFNAIAGQHMAAAPAASAPAKTEMMKDMKKDEKKTDMMKDMKK